MASVPKLNDFIAQIKREGLARQNRFTVEISLPDKMSNSYRELQLVHLFCEQAVLPGITVNTQPIRTFGETREIVSDRGFETITLTFLVDKKMLVKQFFDDWMNLIIDPDSRLSGYYNDYAKTIKIRTQDLNDNVVYECELDEAYPKAVQAITLDNNAKDVMKLGVTFAYRSHKNSNIAIAGGDPALIKPYVIPAIGSQVTLDQYAKMGITDSAYFMDNQAFQERVNDANAMSNSLAKLNPQGIQTLLGGIRS